MRKHRVHAPIGGASLALASRKASLPRLRSSVPSSLSLSPSPAPSPRSPAILFAVSLQGLGFCCESTSLSRKRSSLRTPRRTRANPLAKRRASDRDWRPFKMLIVRRRRAKDPSQFPRVNIKYGNGERTMRRSRYRANKLAPAGD
jgi:hypothetical protein